MVRSLATLSMLFLAAAPVGAELCSLDDRPGATLLLPYFEVDLARPNGLTTFFTVHNASPERVLARVVLWTDAAYPTFGFEIDLTGYDLQAVNLRDVFAGRLPEPEAARPPSCVTALPPMEDFTTRLEQAHTGRPVAELGGLCAGFDRGDGVARGYVTVDVVGDCTDLAPSDPGYFGAGGVAGHANVLWGDFLYFDPSTGRTEGDLMLSLESDPSSFGAGDPTFYGRYVDDSGVDGREPLPTLWANRFLGGGPLAITSRSIVWRDTGAAPETFACDETPSWWPLGFNEVLSLDERGRAVFLTTDVAFIVPPEPPFPAAAQQGIGFRAWPFGWEILDLNPAPDRRLQSFVMEIVEAAGGASYLRRASPLDDGCSVAGCAYGDTEVRILCLAEDVAPGAPIAVRVFPEGCFSSSCTAVYRALCDVERVAGGLAVEASFCLRDFSAGRVCTEDCGGGGFADCAFGAGLPMGDYTLRLGALELAFSVPQEVPQGGLCVTAGEALGAVSPR